MSMHHHEDWNEGEGIKKTCVCSQETWDLTSLMMEVKVFQMNQEKLYVSLHGNTT
jgi:hypothetical protein